MLAKGQFLDLYVTHVESSGKAIFVWAQTGHDERKLLDSQMNEVQNRVSSLLTVNVGDVKLGDVYLALHNGDTKWYRAQVEDLDKAKSNATVYLYDYGHTVNVPVCNLRKAEPKYFELGPQAVSYRVAHLEPSNGKDWLPEEIALIRAQIQKNEYLAQVLQVGSAGNPPELQIFDRIGTKSPLEEMLVAEGVGRVSEADDHTTTVPITLLELGTWYHVYMSYFNSPVDFWLQLAENSARLDDLNSKIESVQVCGLQALSDKDIRSGTVCIAYASEYSAFYRAVVSNVRRSENKCSVTYLDYGDNEEKNFDELFNIPAQLNDLSTQAIHCCLFGADADIERYISSENLHARVIQVSNSGMHVVRLSEEHAEIAAENAKRSEIIAMPEICKSQSHFKPIQFDTGATFPVCISYVEDTGLFYCQLMENRWKIDEIMMDIQAFYLRNSQQPSVIDEGDALIVRSSKEDLYHRAEVLSSSLDQVHVKLVDFGETESVPLERVFVIDERHIDLQGQAVCCQLDDSDTLPTSIVSAFLKTYESKKSLMAKVVLKTPKCSMIKLVDTSSDNEDVDLLIRLRTSLSARRDTTCTSKPSSSGYIQPRIKEGMMEDAIVSYVDTPDNFYCKLVSTEDEFNSMSEQMEAYCNSLKPGQGRLQEVTIGTQCIARDEDQEWYRAIVTEVGDQGTLEVLFVDFGNPGELALDEVIAIHDKFLELPMQAVRCGLRGVHCKGSSEWSDIHVERFSTVQNNNQLVHFGSHDAENNRYLVDLYGPYTDETPVNINKAFGIQFGLLIRNYQEPPSMKTSVHPTASAIQPTQNLSTTQSTRATSRKHDTSSVKSTDSSLSGKENHFGARPKYVEKIATVRKDDAPSQSFEQTQNIWSGGRATQPNGNWKSTAIRTAEISSGDTVYVAFVASPSRFWCQPAVSSELLISMAHTLNTEYTKMTDSEMLLHSPSVGQMCCALYTEDYSWYRAKILDVTGRNARVYFVDYGNGETVSVSTLKELKRSYSKLPCQAVQCSLGNVSPKSGEWSDSAIEKFSKLCAGKELQVQFLERRGNVHHVELGLVGRRGTDIGHAIFQESIPSSETSSFQSSVGSVCPPPDRFEHVQLTPGESVDVNVVHVSDPHNFFCQLTRSGTQLGDLMHTIARDLSRHDVAIKRIVRPRIGQVCGAKYDPENKWYRAEIVATEGSQVMVNFVDFGDEQWVGTEGLKTLKKQHIELPAQAVQCCLDNITPAVGQRWTTTAISAFEDLVYDKNLVAQVLAERKGVYTVRLIVPGIGRRPDYSVADRLTELRIGSNVEAVRQPRGRSSGETSSGSAGSRDDKVDLRTMQLNIGSSYQMNLTWVENPKEFWCQRAEASNNISAMCDEMFQSYNSLSVTEYKLKNPTIGQYCMTVKASDGSWYRARIIGQKGTQYEVQYVDFGDTDTVSPLDMKKILTRFASVPCQAFRCCLQGVDLGSDGEWSSSAVSVFEELLLQTVTLTVCKSSGNKYTVLLQDQDGADVADKIVASGSRQPAPMQQLGVHKQSSTAVTELDNEISSLRVDQTLSVQVVHVDNHTSLSCQLRSKILARDEMMDKLDAHCRSLGAEEGKPRHLEQGLYCVAKFSEDGGWYRARIMDKVGLAEYLVHYIDYGNKEVVHVKDLGELPPHCARLPSQALHCSLSGVPNQTKNAEATQKLMMLTDGKNLKAKVRSISDVKLEVDLVDESSNRSINEQVASLFGPNQIVIPTMPVVHIKQSYVKRTVPLKNPLSVYPSHVESPGRFFLQFANEEDQLTELATDLNDKYCDMNPSEMCLPNAAVGDACVARFGDDGSWYRATIMEVNRRRATVRFLDYGNTDQSDVCELKQVVEKYSKTSPFALECALSVGKVSAEKRAKFEEILMAEDADVQAEFLDSVEPVSTRLKINGQDVLQMLELKVQHPSYKEPEVLTGVKVKVIPTFIESPTCVYVQIAAVEEESQLLVDTVNEHYSKLRDDEMVVDEPIEGMACVVQFSEDNSWYRAVICNIAENQATVTFVDFGNTDVVPLGGIKMVNKKFLEAEPYAISCRLRKVSEPTDGWPEELCTDFEAKLMEEDVMVAAEFHSTREPVEVDLFLNSKNLVDVMELERDDSTNHVEEINDDVIFDASEPTFPIPVIPTGEVAVHILSCISPADFYVQLLDMEDNLEAHSAKLQEDYTKYDSFEEDSGLDPVSEESATEVTEIDEGVTSDSSLLSIAKVVVAQVIQSSIIRRKEELDISRDSEVGITEENEANGGIEVEESGADYRDDEQDDSVNIDDMTTEISEGTVDTSAIDRATEYQQKETEASAVGDRVSYDNSLDFIPRDVRVGLACVAKCPDDGRWYRSVVTEVEESDVRVKFIDYGKTASVEICHLRKALDQHMDKPPFAYHCTLGNLREHLDSWTDQDKETFLSASKVCGLKAFFVTDREPFKVKMTTDGTDLLAKLPADWSCHFTGSTVEESFSQKLASEVTGPSEECVDLGEEKSPEDSCYASPNLHSGQILDVYASEVESPSSFFLQVASREDELTKLAEEVNEYYSAGIDVRPLEKAEVKRPCVAQYTDVDGSSAWYRAKIVKLEGDVATVMFVDYGNSETVNIQKLKEVADSYLSIVPYAMACTLENDITEDAVERFAELLVEAEELTAEIVDVSDPIVVKLTVNGTDVLAMLNEETSASSTEKLAEYATPDLPHDQTATAEITTAELQDEKPATYAAPDPPDLIKKHGEETVVGSLNEETSSSLEHEPARYAEPDSPLQINQLGAIGAEPSEEPDAPDLLTHVSPDAHHRTGSKGTVYEEPATFAVADAPDFGKMVEETTEKSEMSADNCNAFTDATPDSGIGLTIEGVKRLEVYVSYVESPDQFWIQRKGSEELLKELTETLKSCVGGPEVDKGDVSVGKTFVARYSEDDTWQRVKVKAMPEAGKVDVVYIDYGNSETLDVSDMLCLPFKCSLEEQPAQATKFGLRDVQGVGGCWSEDATAYFKELVLDKLLLAEIDAEKDDKCTLIRLFDVDTSIGKRLQEAGHAVDDKAQNDLKLSGEKSPIDIDVSANVSREECSKDAVIPPLSIPVSVQTPVYVSHCESPSNFYIQLSDTYQLEELTELMQKVYGGKRDLYEFDLEPECGQLCAAFSNDDHLWYRAKVLDIVGDNILVKFTDYGNTEAVTTGVKPLLQQFLDTPALAVQCTLADIAPLSCDGSWGQDCIDTFLAETGMQRELLVEVQSTAGTPGPQGDDNVQRVKLLAGSTSIAELLVDSNLAAYSNEGDVPKLRNRHVEEGDVFQVYVTSVVTPNNFMCQLTKPSSTELPLLMDKIHDYCASESDSSRPAKLTVGMACLAMYSKDSDWYRAEITDVQDNMVHVSFVDYGNNDAVDIAKIRRIPSELLSLPRPVLSCMLYGVEPIGKNWDEISCARFEELCECENQELTAKVMSVLTTGEGSIMPTITVQLTDKDGQVNISDMLLDGGYAKRPDEFLSSSLLGSSMSFLEESQGEVDPVLSVRYLHGQSPGNFTCQLRDSKERLTGLMREINTTAEQNVVSLPFEDCKVGRLCLAQLGDKTWYRASITSIRDGVCEVKCIDNGTRSTQSVDALRPLPACEQKLAAQAMACQLAGIETECWTSEAILEFEDMCSVKDLRLKIVGELGEEELTLVYLYDGSDSSGQSINSHLVSKGYAWLSTLNEAVEKADPDEFEHNQDEQEDSFLEVSLVKSSSFGSLRQSLSESELESESIKYRTVTLEGGEVCRMIVVKAKDPDNIICQPTESAAELGDVMKHLQETYEDSESLLMTEMHLSQPCVLQCPKDNRWYRGQIVEIYDESLVEVYFVDFGRKDVVEQSRLRILVPDEALVSLPMQAVHCVLFGVSPEGDIWHEDVEEFLQNTICGDQDNVQVAVVTVEDDNRIVVKITTSELESLSDMLVENELATVLPADS